MKKVQNLAILLSIIFLDRFITTMMKILFIQNIKGYISEIRYNRLLRLSPYQFDQTHKGWRKLKHLSEQTRVINHYLNNYKADPMQWKDKVPKSKKDPFILLPWTLHWHLGQGLAHKGKHRYEEAITNLAIAFRQPDKAFQEYADLTIKFLEGDIIVFEKAFKNIKRLQGLNLRVIKSLREGLRQGLDYARAYNIPVE